MVQFAHARHLKPFLDVPGKNVGSAPPPCGGKLTCSAGGPQLEHPPRGAAAEFWAPSNGSAPGVQLGADTSSHLLHVHLRGVGRARRCLGGQERRWRGSRSSGGGKTDNTAEG